MSKLFGVSFAVGLLLYSGLGAAFDERQPPPNEETRTDPTFTRDLRPSQFLNATLSIPPGAANHKVDTGVGFLQDVAFWGIFPHTHVRGTRWEYRLALRDGTLAPLLSVPRYDFTWQTYYMFKEPIALPKGARILSSAWYDNSGKNPSNPDPTSRVTWGDQTWEEMQYTGFIYSVRTPAATSAPLEKAR
jgi:hypothetical protein